MKKTKRWVLGLLLAVLGMALTACNTGGDVDSKVLEGKVLRVGMECAYPPFNWTQMDDANGAVAIETGNYASGYDIEIAKRIAASMGKELVIVKTNWEGLPPALQSGVIDMIIAGMSPTEDRKQSIDFSDPYYQSDLVMVVKKGGAYENATSIQDFDGAKITAQLGTFHYSVIPQIQGVDMRPAMDDFGAMRVALDSGIIDGYVSERPEAISAAYANPNFTFVSFTDGFEASPADLSIAVGLRKGSVLAEPINAAIATITETERAQLMDAAIRNQPLVQAEGEPETPPANPAE